MPCAGGDGPSTTEFASGWDPQLGAELGAIWSAKGYLSGTLLPAEELVRAVDTVLRSDPAATIPSITVAPRPLS